jgi:hypothetical protein
MTAGMLISLAIAASAMPQAVLSTDYPFGSFWPDEKTLPMEGCVSEFSFEVEGLTLMPPSSNQQTDIVSFSEVEGEMFVRTRRKIGCAYDCRIAVKGKLVSPVICNKVGSV